MDKLGKAFSIKQFWEELKRRRVIRATIIYVVAGWFIIEIASTLIPNLNLPEWTSRLITILIILGLPISKHNESLGI